MSIFNLIDLRVKDSIKKYSTLLEGKSSDVCAGSGFMLYALETIFKNIEIDNIHDGIVDSSFRGEKHDYGIDAIYLTANGDYIDSLEQLEDYNKDSKFVIHILQFKKSKGIDQADLLKIKEGIDEVFIDENCDESKNEFLFDLIENLNEIKNELYKKFSAQQIKVNVYIVFGGLEENILKDDIVSKQLGDIREILNNGGYQYNEIIIIDAQKLLLLEKQGDEIVDIIKIHKTVKYITELENEKKLNGYISIVGTSEIGKLVKIWQNQLFEANIRDFYKRNELNNKILDTAASDDEAKYFWSFNNGLTITCRKVEELPNDQYKLYGLQIVNGCQTSNSLYIAYNNMLRLEELRKKDHLSKDEQEEFDSISSKALNTNSTVLLKIIETNDTELIYRITETTNSQTPIKTFSLKANEDIQRNIEDFLLPHNIYYERRINFYRNQGKKNIITIQKLFQLYFSQILFKPSQVKTRPKQMFQEHYDSVFPAPKVKTISFNLYLIPILIDLKLLKKIRVIQRSKSETDSYNKIVLSYGKYHLGLLILHSILGNNYNEKKLIDNAEKIIKEINDDRRFEHHYKKALLNLVRILKKGYGQRKESVPISLKKTDLDNKLVRFIKSSS